LSKDGRLWAFDLDPNAVAVGQKLEALEPRLKILHRPLADVHVTWRIFIDFHRFSSMVQENPIFFGWHFGAGFSSFLGCDPAIMFLAPEMMKSTAVCRR
jgi:hypothetical protein